MRQGVTRNITQSARQNVRQGMRRIRRTAILTLTAFLFFTSCASADSAVHPDSGQISADLADALPKSAEVLLDPDTVPGTDRDNAAYGPEDFAQGVERILHSVRRQFAAVLRQRLRGAVSVLFVVLLCGTVRNLGPEGDGGGMALSLAGALAVTGLTVGSLDQLIGMGMETIRELNAFSAVLLPALAAATAATGAVTTATFQHVSAVFLSEALIGLIDSILIPLTSLYISVLTASCALGGGRLDALAALLKRVVTSILTLSLLGFTAYLSVFRIITGPTDAAAVRTAKAAISGAVPVVGGVISETAEAILAGAGILRASVGIFGLLGVLGACTGPFMQLGIQYLLYKGAAVLASVSGSSELCKLIDGLGGAFGLVLGMTGCCALLLLVAILSFVSAAA